QRSYIETYSKYRADTGKRLPTRRVRDVHIRGYGRGPSTTLAAPQRLRPSAPAVWRTPIAGVCHAVARSDQPPHLAPSGRLRSHGCRAGRGERRLEEGHT